MIEFSPGLQGRQHGASAAAHEWVTSTPPEPPGFTGFWAEDLPLSSTKHRRVSRKQN